MSMVIALPAKRQAAKELRLPSFPILFALLIAAAALTAILFRTHPVDGAGLLFGP